MATRWGCPCGCITVYEVSGDTVTPQAHEVKCELHKDVTLENIISTLQLWCRDNPVE